jgi:HAD superfamily hydrolase (TIGR01484 family)
MRPLADQSSSILLLLLLMIMILIESSFDGARAKYGNCVSCRSFYTYDSMRPEIRLLSTDFDGTLVSRVSEPVLDTDCMELIRDLQAKGAIWAINTGRSVDLLESGLTDFSFPFRPDFILTSERDVFRPGSNGKKWEAFGDWNERCAREHTQLFTSASSVLAEVIDFVNQKTKARIVYEAEGPSGLIAASEEEMERVTQFIEQARAKQPKFNYQRNTVFLRFCHADYHKGAALAELARLLKIPRENIFAAGDHHNDVSMLNGKFAAMPACPANAIPEVKEAVRKAGGFVAEREHGAGIYDALVHFLNGNAR